jgi:hypothetical protein
VVDHVRRFLGIVREEICPSMASAPAMMR